jgi:transposase
MTPTAATLVPEQLWQAIRPLLPTPPPRCGGRPRVDDRAALAGIVYQLWTGIQLLDQLGRDSKLDWSRASLDSISVRAKWGAA